MRCATQASSDQTIQANIGTDQTYLCRALLVPDQLEQRVMGARPTWIAHGVCQAHFGCERGAPGLPLLIYLITRNHWYNWVNSEKQTSFMYWFLKILFLNKEKCSAQQKLRNLVFIVVLSAHQVTFGSARQKQSPRMLTISSLSQGTGRSRLDLFFLIRFSSSVQTIEIIQQKSPDPRPQYDQTIKTAGGAVIRLSRP